MKKVIVDENSLSKILDRLAVEIVERHTDINKLCLVGIKTRGVYIAQRLHERIKNFYKIDLPLGVLDITLYRDDLTQVAQDPQMKGVSIVFDINGKDIVLVDDVLYTGRTVRCALDAIMDQGRPRKVELLVIVDRGHKEIPIMAEFIGREVSTADDDIIHVHIKERDGDDMIVHNIGGQKER